MFPEKDHNYPEGYEKTPWCPNSKLVEICNSLAGLKPTPEYFCTNEIENGVWSGDMLNHLEIGDFVPNTSCHRSNLELVSQLKIVKGDVPHLPGDNEIKLKIEKANSKEEMSEIFKSYLSIKSKYDEKNTIIERWRKVIFEITCSTVGDEKNDHFRQFSSSDELSEKEIIEKVEQFTESLDEIVGYKEGTYGYYRGGAMNCPQSPSDGHFGPMVD